MSANNRWSPGGGAPPLDGLTPIFEEMGTDPRIAPGADRPPASVAKIGTLYLSKFGSAPTQWSPLVAGMAAAGVSTGGNTLGQTGVQAGTLVLAGIGGISLSQLTGVNGATVSISAATGSAGGTNLGALAAGTQTASTGTVALANSNGVTFGMSGSSQVTASVAAGATATGNFGALAAGTQTASSGTVVFASSNGVTFGMSGSSQVTASVAAGATATGNFGALAAGAQTATNGTVIFADSNSVTFGMSGSSQVTASIPAGASATGNFGALAAGTQTATAGTVVFANSNAITFGMSGSSQVTASMGAISQVLAGTGSATANALNRLQMQDSFGAFWGASGSRLFISAADYVKGIGVLDAGGGGGTNVISNTLWLSQANGVTFGISTSVSAGSTNWVITASVAPGATATGNLGALAAGTQTASSGTVTFANSNGVSFGMSGSNQVTASVTGLPTISLLENWRGVDLLAADASARIGSLLVQRFVVPAAFISATQLDMNIFQSNSSSAGATLSLRWGIYTLSGSTASLASSGSRSAAYNSTAANSSYTAASNWRAFSTPVNWSITPGDYLVAFNIDSASALTNGTISFIAGRNSTFLGEPYVAQNYSKYFDVGMVNTNGLPASIHLSAITQTAASNAAAVVFPWFKLIGTF